MQKPKHTALITGASSGIGLELARIMASKGFRLVLVARNEKALRKIADEINRLFSAEVHIMAADLSLPGMPETVFRQCQDLKLTVDILINNAGFGDFGHFAESDWKKQDQMIQLNIGALTHLTHLFLPSMIQHGTGRIMQVSSTAAFQPGPLMSVYYASKAYVLHFSEAIADELSGTGVTVTALCPGATQSGFQEAAAMQASKLVKDKKLPTAEEVAEFGYRAMMRGKRVAIHGAKNYLLANSVRFTPRNWVVKMVRMMQKS